MTTIYLKSKLALAKKIKQIFRFSYYLPGLKIKQTSISVARSHKAVFQQSTDAKECKRPSADSGMSQNAGENDAQKSSSS